MWPFNLPDTVDPDYSSTKLLLDSYYILEERTGLQWEWIHCSGAARRAGSESPRMGTAHQCSWCRCLCAKAGARCLERAFATCCKMLEKRFRNGRNQGWEISLGNQAEGRKSVKREKPFENPLFPSSGFTLESWSCRLSGGVQDRPGFITEVVKFQRWVKILLQLGVRGWAAPKVMCPPRLRPSQPGSSVWAEPVGNWRRIVNRQALWHPIEIGEVPVHVLLF